MGLIKEIEAVEKVAIAGVANASANGKFPHWPVDRWISVIGFTGAIIAAIFGAGSRWNRLSSDVDGLQRQVETLSSKMDANQTQTDHRLDALANSVAEIKLQVTPPAVSVVPARPRMTFPSDSQFFGGRN